MEEVPALDAARQRMKWSHLACDNVLSIGCSPLSLTLSHALSIGLLTLSHARSAPSAAVLQAALLKWLKWAWTDPALLSVISSYSNCSRCSSCVFVSPPAPSCPFVFACRPPLDAGTALLATVTHSTHWHWAFSAAI